MLDAGFTSVKVRDRTDGTAAVLDRERVITSGFGTFWGVSIFPAMKTRKCKML